MVSLGAGFLGLRFKPNVRKLLSAAEFTDVPSLVDAARAAFSGGFSENPFLVECPSLETVFFEPDLSVVCEAGQRSISQTLSIYDGLSYSETAGFHWITSDTIPEFDFSWDRMVTYYHLETAEFIYDLIERLPGETPHLLERRPNVAGRPWYTITPGHINNEPSPDKRFQPLIAAVYPTVQIMNVTRTLLQSGALNTGRPMYQEVAERGSASTLPEIMAQPMEQRPVILFDPSQKVLDRPRRGYRYDVVPAPSMEWVISAYQESKKDLQDWGFPISLSPQASTSGDAASGVQAMQEMEVAAHYLNPALTNVARSLSELLILLGDVIKGLELPVTIPMRRRAEGGDRRVRETVTVSPADFQEQDLEVRLESVPASAKIAIKEDERRDLQLGLMSKRTWMMRRYDDYLAEQKRIQIDKAYAFADEKALETVQQFIQAQSGAIAAQVAAEQNIPLPPGLIPQSGGPAPDEAERFACPPVPVQGAGTPNPIPEQAGPLGTPQAAGAAQQVAAP